MAKCCDGLDEMLTIVEDQENSLVAQMRNQARSWIFGLDRQSQHQRKRRGDEIRIAQRSEVDEQHGAQRKSSASHVRPPPRPWSCRRRRDRDVTKREASN